MVQFPIRRLLPSLLSASLLLASLPATSLRAQEAEVATDYEVVRVLQATDFLSPQYLESPYFSLDTVVPTVYGRNQYTLRTDYGVFSADGNYELVQRVSELYAIARLQEVSKSDEYLDALKEAAKSPVRLAKNLVRDPVKTVVDVPRGIGKFLSRAGSSIKERVDGRERSDYDESGAKDMIGFSKAKRELAIKLGVNPYSTNEVLQKELDGVAWAAFAGKMTFSVALIPVGGTAGQVITGVNMGAGVTDALRDLPPVELREHLGKVLVGQGIDEGTARDFLNQPHYSPTLQAETVDALHRLQGVKGKGQFLQAATDAENEADATFYMRCAELISQVHAQTPLAQIEMVDGLPVCLAKDQTIIIPLEWDYAAWTEGAGIFSRHLKSRLPEALAGKQMRLVITGIASPRLKAELAARQIGLTEKALPGPLQ